MDILNEIDIKKTTDTDSFEEELVNSILDYDDFIVYINQHPSIVISPPLKPNQTNSTEKISIRIPRYILKYYRAESIRTGVGYQKLIKLQLAKVFKKELP